MVVGVRKPHVTKTCCSGVVCEPTCICRAWPVPGLGPPTRLTAIPVVIEAWWLLPCRGLISLTLQLSLTSPWVRPGVWHRCFLCQSCSCSRRAHITSHCTLGGSDSLSVPRRGTEKCRGIYTMWREIRDRKDPEDRWLALPPVLHSIAHCLLPPPHQKRPVWPAVFWGRLCAAW